MFTIQLVSKEYLNFCLGHFYDSAIKAIPAIPAIPAEGYKTFSHPSHIFESEERDYSGLYYKPMTIVNDDARVVNKLEVHLLTTLESSFTIVTCI